MENSQKTFDANVPKIVEISRYKQKKINKSRN